MSKYVLEVRLHKEITIGELIDKITWTIAKKEILKEEHVDIPKQITFSFDCYNFHPIIVKNNFGASIYLPLCLDINKKINHFYILLKRINIKGIRFYDNSIRKYNLLKDLSGIKMNVGSRILKIKKYNIINLIYFND